jgi:hypothetical protein
MLMFLAKSLLPAGDIGQSVPAFPSPPAVPVWRVGAIAAIARTGDAAVTMIMPDIDAISIAPICWAG